MSFEASDFPNLLRACQSIDDDSGVHHMHRLAEGLVDPIEARMERAICGTPRLQMMSWDEFLGALSDDEFETVCAGEQSERDAILSRPGIRSMGLNDYLNRFFEDSSEHGADFQKAPSDGR